MHGGSPSEVHSRSRRSELVVTTAVSEKDGVQCPPWAQTPPLTDETSAHLVGGSRGKIHQTASTQKAIPDEDDRGDGSEVPPWRDLRRDFLSPVAKASSPLDAANHAAVEAPGRACRRHGAERFHFAESAWLHSK